MPKAISAIFGVSPMPNHRMNNGMSARWGRVRAICKVASTVSSPSRESPAIKAKIVPSATPIPRPTVTRTSDTRRFVISCPVTSNCQKLSATVMGEGIKRVWISPAEARPCQIARIATGTATRCAPVPNWRRPLQRNGARDVAEREEERARLIGRRCSNGRRNQESTIDRACMVQIPQFSRGCSISCLARLAIPDST